MSLNAPTWGKQRCLPQVTAQVIFHVRKKIAEGLDSLRRGEGVDGEAVFDRLQAELSALDKRKAG